MLETYELFLVGMLNGLSFINFENNLYYCVHPDSTKIMIKSDVCIMNDPGFIDKNIFSMCMFLQSFKCRDFDV
jgi:hypothetical protein